MRPTRLLRACLAATAAVFATLALSACGSGNGGGAGPTTVRQRPLPAADDVMIAECARRTGANRGCPNGHG